MEKTPILLKGGCLCGEVRYELTGPTTKVDVCHCSLCRKVSGAAHSATVITLAEHIRFVSGEDQVQTYTYSDIYTPNFCRQCGSPVPLIGKGGYWFIPAGTLDADPGVGVWKHIFVDSKAAWDRIGDDAPQWAMRPPDRASESKSSQISHGVNTKGAYK